MLWETAARVGERVAVSEHGATTTYAQLVARASAIGRALQASGVQPGDRAAVFLERGADAAAAFFGVLAAGAVVVNVNETLRPRQVEHILRHAGARVLLTTGRLLAKQPRRFETEVVHSLVEALPPAAWLEPVERIGSDVAELIYTSGSTGLPKGVTLSHANLWAGTRAVISYVGVTSDDRIASLLPFSFDYGCNQLLCAVATGAILVVERSSVPQHIVAALRTSAVTLLPAVPPLWLQLLTVAAFRSPLPSLRAMTNTGGPLPVDAVRALRRAHPHARLFLMYGLTEAFRSTYLSPEEVDRRPDSIGRAIPGAEILVLREDETPAAPGEVGELVHRGPTVGLGYWDDPAATARVYRPHPLRPPGTPDAERVVYSGDLVRRDAEGFIYYVGRRDRLLKVLGHRVSLDEVATALYASGEIVEAVVSGEPDPVAGALLVAYVVLAPEGSLEALQAYCQAELPRYLRPARFEARERLPRLSSGKYALPAASEAHDPG
jgi:amino acid adenylation domain-containing protein